jgi:hypothetical protein
MILSNECETRLKKSRIFMTSGQYITLRINKLKD